MNKFEQSFGQVPEFHGTYVSPDYPSQYLNQQQQEEDAANAFAAYNNQFNQNNNNQTGFGQTQSTPTQPTPTPIPQPVPLPYQVQPFPYTQPIRIQCIHMDDSNKNIDGLVAVMALDDTKFKPGTSVHVKIDRLVNKPIGALYTVLPHIPADNCFPDEFMGIIQDCDPSYLTILTVTREGIVRYGYVSIYDIVDGIVSVKVLTPAKKEESKHYTPNIQEQPIEVKPAVDTCDSVVKSEPVPEPTVSVSEPKPITINPMNITSTRVIPTSDEIVNAMMNRSKTIF
jgi:hypothetical protein